MIACSSHLDIRALTGVPVIAHGDNLGTHVHAALARDGLDLRNGDVIVVSSKVVSRSEGRMVDVSTIRASNVACAVAEETRKDPRVVELILQESERISRKAQGALIVRHRLGFVSADAGIDFSNVGPPRTTDGTGPWALLLPIDPDASAERLRAALRAPEGAVIGVVISDSFGRPFRLGTVGVAIGVAGLPALWNQRGGVDLFGRILEHTITAFADQIAAAADLVAGQAAEGRPFIHVRGLAFGASSQSAHDLVRPPETDLYA